MSAQVYKFRGFDDYGKKFLLEQELYFSSPDKLNDPIDCRLPLLFELGSEDQLYTKNLEYMQLLYPGVPKAELEVEARFQAKVMHRNKDDPEKRIQFRNRMERNINESFGVASFSKNNTNSLLWSYYADGHRGFCVEIEIQALLQAQNQLVYQGVVLNSEDVSYFDELPGIDPYSGDDISRFLLMMYSKHSAWSHEEEWRIISMNSTNFAVHIPIDFFKAIYLGMACSDKNQEMVIEFARSRSLGIPVMKARSDGGNSGVVFEEISYT